MSRLLDKQRIDLILPVTRPAGILANVDDLRIGFEFVEQFMRDEPIMNHHVSLLEQL